MKAYVFTDGALTRHAGRFVWLSVDTEREETAAFVERFPVEAWPTLMVVDPRTEKVAVRWLGSMTVAQLEGMLLDGERAVKGTGGALETRLAEADRAYGEKRHPEAVALLDALRRDAPPDWASRGRVVETLLMSQSQLEKYAECFRVAQEELPRIPKTASYANVAALGLFCGLELPEAERQDGVAKLETAVREALHSDIEMAADDRSGLYDALYTARSEAKQPEEAKVIAGEWATFLEQEAAKAKTPQQRTVFDAHRLVAYLRMGQAQKAIPMLEQSERDLPEDYNPPARLTIAFRELGRFPEAMAASDRALKKAYGPRKVRVFIERANTLKAMNDPLLARKAVEEGIAYVGSLPTAQQAPWMMRTLGKMRAELPAPSPAPAR